MAYSAAYWLAAAAERVYVPITGGVGSIGAVALHVDQSKRDKMMGYTYTFMYAGAKKVDLNSHQPLSDRGRARLQAEVDRFYGLFVADVAKDRGLSAEAVRATQAGLLTPTEAQDGGYVDGVIATLSRDGAAPRGSAAPAAAKRACNGARMSAGRSFQSQSQERRTTMKLSAAAAAVLAALGLNAETMEAAQRAGARRRASARSRTDARAEGKAEAEKAGARRPRKRAPKA
jgi:ClpP class serine protease